MTSTHTHYSGVATRGQPEPSRFGCGPFEGQGKAMTIKGYRFRSKELPTQGKAMSARANRAGRVVGRLTVVEDLGVASHGHRWWGCVCECGTRFAARSREIDRGHTQSCGCLQAEVRGAKGGHNKLAEGVASRNELLASYKKSARDRGLEWGLSDAEFVALIANPCCYCMSPAAKVRKPNSGVNGGFTYSGIDRVDSKLGYVTSNVVACCWDCNRAKGALGVAEFLAWVDRIAAARGARFEHGECGV